MLNDLINKVAEKTGLSSENASLAVSTVLDCLKKKLPAPLASQIDSFLNGESAISDIGEKAKDSASDMLGSAKEKLSSLFNKK